MPCSKSRRDLSARKRERKRLSTSHLLRRRVQGSGHRRRQPVPAGCFLTQAAPSCGGQLVILCSAIILAHTPFGGDQFLVFQPVKRRIQGSLWDLQRIARDLLNAL